MAKTNIEDFNKLGGREMLRKISEIFYDKVYKHPWLGLYFQKIDQEIITSQQVDFMTSALGGGQVYCGQLPVVAHQQMNISEELYDLRTDLLTQSLDEAKASADLKEKWLRIDLAFKGAIVKKSVHDCKKRFFTDEILDFPNPLKKSA